MYVKKGRGSRETTAPRFFKQRISPIIRIYETWNLKLETIFMRFGNKYVNLVASVSFFTAVAMAIMKQCGG